MKKIEIRNLIIAFAAIIGIAALGILTGEWYLNSLLIGGFVALVFVVLCKSHRK